MSTVMIPPTIVMNATSLGASGNSNGIHTMFTDNIGIQLVWTGTPTGQFGIDVSNTAVLGPTGAITGGTWTAITGTYPAPAGSASNGFISLTNLCAAFIRISYTRGSGSGTVTATLCGKSI